MSEHFKSSIDYFEQVAAERSNPSEWNGLRIFRSIETSNDVTFENTTSHSLTLDHTGTARHLSRMDGINFNRPTHPGEICQIPAGLSARFAWEVAGDVQHSSMIIFDSCIFKAYCPEIASCAFLDGHLLPRDFAPDPALSMLVQLLEGELDQSSARGLLYAQTIIRLLALEIAANQWSRKPEPRRVDTATDPRVSKAVEFIHENLSGSLSLVDLAAASGLRPTRLTEIFKKTVGKCPYEYVVNLRIEAAIRLLKHTDTPLSHIALEVGFADQQHMTHAFQLKGQRTPSSFRKWREAAE